MTSRLLTIVKRGSTSLVNWAHYAEIKALLEKVTGLAEDLSPNERELFHALAMRYEELVTGAFDGSILTVHIPMEWKCRDGREVIIAQESSDAWAPAKPRPDETLIRALGRTHRWKRLLEEGVYGSPLEIAEAKKPTKSFVNRLLRLTLLAPDIQETILDGGQPKGMQLKDLMQVVESEWEQQRRISAKTHR